MLRLTTSALYVGTPVFFPALCFADRFRVREDANLAFGRLLRLIRLDREPIRTTEEDKLHYIEETVPDIVAERKASHLRSCPRESP